MRWGLVFCAVLVGTSGLARLLGWYFDPMRTNEGTSPAFTTPRSVPVARGALPAAPAPLATPVELALLDSPDLTNQLRGAETLLTRAATPDVVRAVDNALGRSLDPHVEARLVCVKSRFDDPEILEFLLARFPKDRATLDWNLKPDVSCVLDALVEKIGDAPERVRDALLPGIYASNATTREKVLKAFRLTDLPTIPAPLLVEASTEGAPFRREAVAAALALGALRLNPTLVARAVRDQYLQAVVSYQLRIDPHPNAARIVANVWAERSFDSQYAYLARERERQMHDVSAALLEILSAETESEQKRVAAAEQLGQLGEIGALHGMRAIVAPDFSRLKSAVDRAIAALEDQQKRGARNQMRALPQ